jgi:hypothetical protein
VQQPRITFHRLGGIPSRQEAQWHRAVPGPQADAESVAAGPSAAACAFSACGSLTAATNVRRGNDATSKFKLNRHLITGIAALRLPLRRCQRYKHRRTI